MPCFSSITSLRNRSRYNFVYLISTLDKMGTPRVFEMRFQNDKARPLIKKMLILIIFPGLISCANVRYVSTVISPRKVDEWDLQSLKESTTPEYGFRVSVNPQLSDKKDKIINNVDAQFREFSRCMRITDTGARAKPYLISVVDGTFECKYHGGRCNGEYDADNNLVTVTYRAFNRKGVLPLLKHEWSHVYGFLKSDDSNLDEIRGCTRY